MTMLQLLYVIARRGPERSEAESKDCAEAISKAHGGLLRSARNDGILRHLVTLSPCLLVALLLASTVTAQVPASFTQARPGNYCIECHTDASRAARVFEWQGGIGREQVAPCPALKKLREEVYYTEALLGAIDNSGKGLQASGIAIDAMDKRVTAQMETWGRLTQEQVTGLTPVETELKSLRFQLNKTFSRMYENWDDVTFRTIVILAILGTLVLVASIAWGWRNTRVAKNPGLPSPVTRHSSLATSHLSVVIVIAIIVFAIFALPVFSTVAPAAAVQTEEQARREDALDSATRVAQAAETASARAWMLARIGAGWVALDKTKGEAALTAGLEAVDEFLANAPAYWGRARELEESAVTWSTRQDLAADAAARIAIAASRAWSLRAIAAEWAAVDRAQAASFLARAQTLAEKSASDYYRDLDLYGVAVEWARLDVAKGLGVARTIRDPLLRSWAFRDIGALQAKSDAKGAASAYMLALEAARQTTSPAERAWSLQELGARWAALDKAQAVAALNEAQTAIAQIKSPENRAYALRNLASAWATIDAAKALQIAESIDAAYPDARASALHQAGAFDKAIEFARRIERVYQRDVALTAIARDWASVAPDQALAVAATIDDAYLRAEVQRAAALAFAASSPEQALKVARDIAIPFHKAQALVRIGVKDPARANAVFQEAFDLADQLQDTYPLRELAVAWAKTDAPKSLQVVEKIQRDVDRAAALREISVTLAAKDRAQAEAVFDRALAAAKAMRRSGDRFASAEALRQLGAAWSPIHKSKAALAFQAAFESAQRVSVKY